MKKILIASFLFLAGLGVCFAGPAAAYDFGDYRSVTLTTKAWQSLAQGDLEAVLAYTNKCIELYGQQADKMQASLTQFPTGTNSEIHSYWALNDVATSLFIQGEIYRKKGMTEEAKKAYQTVTEKYSFGQCWDTNGWFWKPAEAAKGKIAMIDSGTNVDLSDTSSSALTAKAWEALNSNDLDAVVAYADKCVSLYQDKAKEMQAELQDYVKEPKEKVFTYWALNDVGTCLYIKAKALENAGKAEEAKQAYSQLVSEFKFAQCWDPAGWFWKPAEAAQEQLQVLAGA